MSRRLSHIVLAFALTASGCASLSQTATRQARPQPTPADKIERQVSEPYTGTLDIFEDPKRDENLQINRVMDALKINQGKSVADIGAGSGWFTVRAARRVGASGAVYAVEINQDYINHINNRAKAENLPVIKTVLGAEDNPRLPAKAIDAALMLKTYHEIAEPVRVLRNLRGSLKAGGRLGVIDRNGNGGDHGIDRDVVVREAAQAGFKLVEEYDFVKPDGMDYFLVFESK